MAVTASPRPPQELFRKSRVLAWDQTVFIFKLTLAVALAVGGGYLALRPSPVLTAAGVLILGAVYTHMVELQHQCLHHSAFRTARPHRLVGVPLGVPLLVSYSHYRVRHLQHHRFLGTPQDSEFFGFDSRKPITPALLLRGLFDYARLLVVVREVVASCTGTWTYDAGQIAERRRREVVNEYRLFGLIMVAAATAVALGHGETLLRLWLLPLLVAIPMHFLVELPEHLLCETETTDVLRNTRSISGSWLTTWFTNGNNLHIEHHAAMVVPINRLRERHPEAERHAVHVERSYAAFYRKAARAAWRNRAASVRQPGRSTR
ncbi:fatty acid desaturase family protein [Streptomyces sp. NPDC007172]|uniref:fatty acid desaturase family protein n=1 Tax=unclassified Streptomyces TaxID=2593676 RepID=UPI003681991B